MNIIQPNPCPKAGSPPNEFSFTQHNKYHRYIILMAPRSRDEPQSTPPVRMILAQFKEELLKTSSMAQVNEPSYKR